VEDVWVHEYRNMHGSPNTITTALARVCGIEGHEAFLAWQAIQFPRPHMSKFEGFITESRLQPKLKESHLIYRVPASDGGHSFVATNECALKSSRFYWSPWRQDNPCQD